MEFAYQEKCNHNFTRDIVQDVYFSRGKQIKFNHLHLNIHLGITNLCVNGSGDFHQLCNFM